MDVVSAIIILSLFHVFKHRLKSKSYIDDTYNYAIAGQAVWSKKPLEQLLFDAAAQASTASSPPFYPSLHRFLISKSNISPLAVQSFFDWLIQILTFLIVTAQLSLTAGVTTLVIYNLSPTIFKDTLYYTDRLWATLLLWVSLWCLGIFLASGDYLCVALIVICHGLLVISHKHSLQMLFIIYVMLCLSQLTFIFAYLFILGEIFILAATWGYSWEIHKGHLKLLRFVRRRLFPEDAGGYGKDQLLFIRKNRPARDNRPPLDRRIFHHLRAGWDLVLYGVVYAIVIARLLLNGLGEADKFYLTIFSAIIITAIMTQFVRRLKFIGEGYRYLQYAAFPAVMTAWPIITSLNSTHIVTISVFVLIWVIGAIYFDLKILQATARNVVNLIDNDFKKLTEDIKKRDWDRFIILPIQKTYAFTWLTGKKILHFLGAAGFWQARDWFPQIRRPLPTFYDEYSIDYLVLDERYVSPDDLDLGDVKEVLRINSWVVFQVNRGREVSTPWA